MAVSAKISFAVVCVAFALNVVGAASTFAPPTEVVGTADFSVDPVNVTGIVTEPSTVPATSPTTESATTPQAVQLPPFLCYDCNSGNPLPGMWRNPACSEAGYMESWNQPTKCNGPCFSRVGLYPAGSVFRGCSSNFPSLPFEVPTEGCVFDDSSNQLWCFCSADACNTVDLTAVSQDYVAQYLNLTAKKPSNSV